jgi:hypothetical protein
MEVLMEAREVESAAVAANLTVAVAVTTIALAVTSGVAEVVLARAPAPHTMTVTIALVVVTVMMIAAPVVDVMIAGEPPPAVRASHLNSMRMNVIVELSLCSSLPLVCGPRISWPSSKRSGPSRRLRSSRIVLADAPKGM